MARLLGTGLGLLALLALIWWGWEGGTPTERGSSLPHFSREPQAAQTPTDPTEVWEPETAGAMLIARSLLPYDGPALWDEGADLSSVAALELWNAGKQTIRYAEVVVQQGERVLTFTVTYIPPNGRVIVPEKDLQVYTRDAVMDISYPVVLPLVDGAGSKTIAVTEDGVFSLNVTNGAEESFSYVRVFYKQYDNENDVYVGGITYSAVLTDLEPGERRPVMPYRYAAGYAKVVAVVTERKTGDS